MFDDGMVLMRTRSTRILALIPHGQASADPLGCWGSSTFVQWSGWELSWLSIPASAASQTMWDCDDVCADVVGG